MRRGALLRSCRMPESRRPRVRVVARHHECQVEASGAPPTNRTAAAAAPDASVSAAAGELPPLVKIFLGVATANLFRVFATWDITVAHLRLVALRGRCADLRGAAVDAFLDVVADALRWREEEAGTPKTPGRGFEKGVEALFSGSKPKLGALSGGAGVGIDFVNEEMQQRLLEPLLPLAVSDLEDVRFRTLNGLHSLLQDVGQALGDGWPAVLRLLYSVAVRQSSEKTVETLCLEVAYKSLRLIIDDFLEFIPKELISQCISCVGAFAAQGADINMALSSLGMFWAVADFVVKGGGVVKGGESSAQDAATFEAASFSRETP
ncbi:hypothetical protein M885DRAFT_212642 [Pelagophyceae sp. CCMP2097]|nr:hypothetical protein M885DRAFT_212642 [Pelagophyceae sp. CCMP2097]